MALSGRCNQVCAVVVLLVGSKAGCSIATTSISAPSRLRVEHRDVSADTTTAHVCIDTRPRFSWDVPSVPTERNVLQYAYNVVVVSTIPKSDASLGARHVLQSVVWDSGQIVSNHSVLVPYVGPTLPLHGMYAWNVTVWVIWDGQSIPTRSTVSALAYFATGYNATANATIGTNTLASAWITTDADTNQLRSEFALPHGKEIVEARIYFSAPGYVHVRMNGVDIMGNDTLGPWTTWSTRMLYRYYDVTTLLQSQKQGTTVFDPTNAVVGVWLGNGQYRSIWTHSWYKGSPPLALALEVHVKFSDGSREMLLSTSTSNAWKAHASPIVSNDVYAGEMYNASAYMHGWDQPGFDDSSWASVKPLSSGDNPLSPRMTVHQFTPIRVVDLVTAVNVTQTGPSTFLYWFPRNAAGVVQLNLQSIRGQLPAGTTLTLKHGEQLYDVDGKTPCLVGCFGRGRNVYYPFGGAVDTYISDGNAGGEAWRPRFTYHGFQFLEVCKVPLSTFE